MASLGVSSAKGTLALLREQDSSIVLFALERIDKLMETFWYEISSDLPIIEELHETSTLPEPTRKMAALVASRVYFHLGELDASVNFALAAGTAFDSTSRSLFTDTILCRCIDQYVSHQENHKELDPRLETLFISLTQTWVLQNETFEDVKEMIGFTLRARRLDFLSTVLKQYNIKANSSKALNFTFKVACKLRDITFRREILRLLADLYTSSTSVADYYTLTQCLLFLRDAPATANLIHGLLNGKNRLVAYQLAFDVFENANQDFLSWLIEELKKLSGETPVDDDLLAVLCGEVTTNRYLNFLYVRCAADIHILNQVKRSIDPHRSVLHNFTVMADAFMYCGTTIDGFLRDNLGWLAKANYWSKFTCTAAVGLIHRGHIDEAMKVLEPYLPQNVISAFPYRESGSLYALGMIYSPLGISRSRQAIDYIKGNLLKFSSSTYMVHGASLGLGLAAIGLQNEELYDALFTCMTGSEAVGGEGAAVAIGMLMLGSGNDSVINDLKNVANEDNQKEKIIRGSMMAIAMIQLGREKEAMSLASELLESSDPWIRLGGCFVLGLAYSGTQSNEAIERLLQAAVKDTFDDVRRNAVIMIGFVCSMNPELCLDMVRVLTESYNPHVRYGVVMALAVSAAGTGLSKVIDVLWDMKDDSVAFVRQGIYIALSLVMVQVTEKQNPLVKEFRQLLETKIADSREDICSKLGCIMATGLLDFGGRNCTFALHRKQHRMAKSTVGMFLFMQYWNWYPYALMISLASHPTCFIGLNQDLKIPRYQFKCNAPPSLFALPKSVQQEKKEAKAAGKAAVVLSTTRKEEEIRQKKLHQPADQAGEKDAANTNGEGDNGEAKKEEEPEPEFFILQNPERVTAAQFEYICHDIDSRYRPLTQHHHMGVCLLEDTKPEMGAEELLPFAMREEDAPPPDPFSYP
eukprot:gene8253-5773_t